MKSNTLHIITAPIHLDKLLFEHGISVVVKSTDGASGGGCAIELSFAEEFVFETFNGIAVEFSAANEK